MRAKVKLAPANVFSDWPVFEGDCAPLFVGQSHGKTDYVCSGCPAVLLRALNADDAERLGECIFQCPKCGRSSAIARTEQGH